MGNIHYVCTIASQIFQILKPNKKYLIAFQ